MDSQSRRLTGLERAVFNADSCTQLIHVLTMSEVGNGVEVQGADLYTPKNPADLLDKYPLLINIEEEFLNSKNFLNKVGGALRREKWRLEGYCGNLKPFLHFSDSKAANGDSKVRVISSEGKLELANYRNIVDEDLVVARPLSTWDDLVSKSELSALSRANHLRFIRLFIPQYLSHNPGYSVLNSEQKMVVAAYISQIKDDDPRNARELTEVLS